MIYPIPTDLVSRFFEGKSIFVKYLPRKTSRLQQYMKLLFYASGGPKAIVGEAIIAKVDYMPISKALRHYGDRIFLNKHELEGYARRFGERIHKDLLLLHLSKREKYSQSIDPKMPITMAGRYIDKRKYLSITKGVHFGARV